VLPRKWIGLAGFGAAVGRFAFDACQFFFAHGRARAVGAGVEDLGVAGLGLGLPGLPVNGPLTHAAHPALDLGGFHLDAAGLGQMLLSLLKARLVHGFQTEDFGQRPSQSAFQAQGMVGRVVFGLLLGIVIVVPLALPQIFDLISVSGNRYKNLKCLATTHMIENKATLVSDVLHGTIVLSPIEKLLISTRSFNRLHNVLQNSTAYFTFPSNRTCRFSHSLGTAKIAGEMFRYGLLNANQEVRKPFLKELFKQIQRIKKKALNDLHVYLSKDGTDPQEILQKSSLKALSELNNPLYQALLIPELTSAQAYDYIIMIQSIRFAALMHDLGHPPFSHVTENALEAIHKGLKVKAKTDINLSEKALVKLLEEFLADGGKFHEVLGIRIAENLLDVVIKDLIESKASQSSIYAAVILKACTLEILKEPDGFFKSIHQIVSSDLDADRLDYVQRDLLMSGLSRESFRPERLIQTYTLLKENNKQEFLFTPSVRALNNIEDFFIQRFHIYKYVIFHHRVVKFDALMQDCIEELAKEHLTKPQRKCNPSRPFVLSDRICGLWQVFPKEARDFPAQSENYYIQWDDAWLLSVLRSEYFNIRNSKNKTRTQELLEKRLDELLSNRKHYLVLYKRPECFHQVDEAFVDLCPKDYNWELLIPSGCTKSHVNKLRVDLTAYLQQLKDPSLKNEERTRLVESRGYFIANVLRLIRQATGPHVPMPFIQKSRELFEKQKSSDGVYDVLVIPKDIKPGVTRTFILSDTLGKPIELGRISRVSDELERGALLVPPFYVYLLTNTPEIIDAEMWRKDFGKILWNQFDAWAKDNLRSSN
jgi:uncharacterized protein